MKNIRDYIHFLKVDIWRVSSETQERRWNLMSILKIVVLSVKLCFKQKLNVQASSLSYYTFFALIPTLAFIIAIFRGFGFDVLVSNYLSKSLATNTDYHSVQVVFSMINSYLTHAKGGMFIGIGLIMLLWSIYNVFSQIEKAINQVWELTTSRNLIRRCAYYLSIVVIIPFLIVISYGINVYFDCFEQNWFINTLTYIKPYLVSCAVLTFVYMVLPNTKVHFTSAFFAGLLTGCAIVIFEHLFFMFMKMATSYNAVYGSLALIPILMLFLRCVWIIVLSGTEISYALQNYEMYNFADDVKKISPRYQLSVEIFLLQLFARQIEDKKPFLSFSQILTIYPFPPRLLSVVLKHMCECKLVSEMEEKERDETVYVLTSDVSNITYGSVFASIQKNGNEDFLKHENPDFDKIWSAIKDLDDRVELENNKTLTNIL